MATASFQTHSFGHPPNGKITKSRARSSVKPILKKLHSTHSEKNSLDLDRAWEDQTTPQLGYGYVQAASSGGDRGRGRGGAGADDLSLSLDLDLHQPSYPADGVVGARSARDVSFTLSATDLANPRGGVVGARASATTKSKSSSSHKDSNMPPSVAVSVPNSTSGAGRKFSHARTTSGTSHISVATSGSGRNGSFIHPFQQTPRTSSPPLHSYANSRVSLDRPGAVDLTKDYDDDDDDNDDYDGSDDFVDCEQEPPRSRTWSASNRATAAGPQSSTSFTTNSQRPSLSSSQRASSLTEVSGGVPLRAATSRSTSSGATPKLTAAGFALSQSRASDAQISTSGSITVVDDAPISPTSTVPMGTSPICSSVAAMSPLRSSLDMNGFRIRSRSEVDTATRQEQVRQARRKFEEKERAKEEKYAREQTRKRERADIKEAHRQERAHTRKGSFGTSGLSSGRNSSSTDIRPTASRKNTSTSLSNSRFDLSAEKASGDDFASRGYDSVPSGRQPHARAEDVHFHANKRSKAAKRKTNGAWTAFMLWLRTRLLRLKK